MEKFGKRILATTIVCVMIMSGLMVLPSTVLAEQGQPDLAVKNIGWRFPVTEGEELLGTVYIQNIGDAPVQDGFWVEVNYAELPGFWQEATDSFQLWVEPPIKAGEIKGVEFRTTALTTNQVNFEAFMDTTNTIAESDESNNLGHICGIAVGVAPGSSINVPVYLRNEMLFGDTFLIEADESTIPDGWSFAGGIPPTTVTALPGGNVVLREGVTVPVNTILNPIFRINAMRQSDGASQSTLIKVLTTPEIGFSFNPYNNEFFVTGIDDLDSDCSVTSKLISKRGTVTLTEYTVANTRGQYTSALVRMVSTEGLNKFEITEIDYNGVTTITPEKNMFLTTFNVDKNGELKHFYQYMKYSPDIHSQTFYNSRSDLTIFRTSIYEENLVWKLDEFQAHGVRILNGEVDGIRLDTSDVSRPCICPNAGCSVFTWCMGKMK